ncbi:Ig-like domain-containing protein [Clostridium chromiireducens]|nr:Ig-like domain-containing protein [Clostridium chromiireducens]
MNNNLTIDSSYKKAIEICGVTATINNTDAKILIKEASDEYGIDYKKIISSTSFNQGNYVFINGVQYLIVDTEEQMSQSIYNVGTFRKINHVAKFVDSETIYQLPCISTNVSKDRLPITAETAGIVEGSGIWSFIAPLNDISKKIRKGKRFLINGDAWEVVSTDCVTEEGIFYTILKQGSINIENDDIVNGVADGLTIPTYTISLSSNNLNLYYNDVSQILATCTKNSVADTSPTITYLSSDPTIATVNANGYITVQNITGSATITVNYHNIIATVTVNASEKPHVYNITLPENNSSAYVGDTYQLNPTCRLDGEVVSNPVISYSSDNTAVASVNGFGLITLLSQGNCNIICSYNGVSASINLTVNVHIYEITLSENSTSIIQDGTYQINATCKKDNIIVDNPNIVYSSSDSNIAIISNTGEITAVNIGNVDITCVYEGVSSILSVTVNAKPVIHTYSIDLTGNSNSLYLGDTLQLTAICKDNDVTVDAPIVTWSSSDTNIVSIDSNGLLTSVALGSATITGEFNGVSTTLLLNVIERPHVYTISLSDSSKTLNVGDSYSIAATCTDNGSTVSSPVLSFTSSDTNIATVSANGTVTTITSGSVTITATYENVSASVSLTVNAQVIPTYSYTWSNGSTGLKYMSSTTFTATKTVGGTVDPNLIISYEWDSVGANLVSSGKVTMTKKANNQWTIKNVNVQTITNCVLTWKDTATGEVIYTAPFQFRYMS